MIDFQGFFYTIVGTVMFIFASGGIILLRKSIITALISLEIALLGVNMSFLGFSVIWQNSLGQVMTLIVLSIGAVEIVVGLAIAVVYYHLNGTILIDK